MRHDVASVTKSITSTLIGLAIQKGYLQGVNERVLSFFPDHAVSGLDMRKQALTLENLLTMRAGWDCGVGLGDPRINLDVRLAEMRATSDWAQYALDLPMVDKPGTRFRYCNANCHLLSTILTQRTGTNALAFARRELFEPIGIHDTAWPADPKGNNYGWGDLQLRPTDMAKFGQLLLQRGHWGKQIVPEGWLRIATRSHVEQTGGRDHYGYFWWVPGEKFPGVFEAVGRGGQRITVWPAKDLVLVYTGGGFNPDDLSKFILQSLRSDKPLPPNANAAAQLRERLAAAARVPASQPVPESPAMATQVSGRNYALTPNSLGLAAFALRFSNTAEAAVQFSRLGHDLRCPVGLDNVERNSTDTLVELPVSAKGQWQSANTFLLVFDRVGGIDCYRFKLKFAEDGNVVDVDLSERTGLVAESFKGTAVP